MASLEVGKVQIYTGDGKGKTTAALGLALRATSYGLNVLMLQFAKKLHCAEHDAAPRLGLRIVQADRDTPELAPRRSWTCTQADLTGRRSDFGRTRRGHAPRLRDARGCRGTDRDETRHHRAHTDRPRPAAHRGPRDLVTEMRLVKHYFDEGSWPAKASNTN